MRVKQLESGTNFRSLNAVGYKTLITAVIAVSLLSAACSGSEEPTAESVSATPVVESTPVAPPAPASLPGNVSGSNVSGASVSVSDGPVLILPPSQERASASVAGDVAMMATESPVDEGEFLEEVEVNPERETSPVT